jgi:hypothetical protein
VARFDLAEREKSGLAGALVHIEQSPYVVPNAFQEEDNARRWSDRAERGQAALVALDAAGPGDGEWKEIAMRNAEVPTTLVAFDKKVTAELLHHAYVLAMVNLHVILGYPLLAMPARERFEDLLD